MHGQDNPSALSQIATHASVPSVAKECLQGVAEAVIFSASSLMDWNSTDER